MTKLRAVTAGIAVAMMLAAAGCGKTTLVRKTMAPDVYRSASVDELEQQISERDAAIRTVKASVNITATEGGSKSGQITEHPEVGGFISLRKPGDIRVILQVPVLHSMMMDMVSNGTTFKLLIPPKSEAFTGSNTVTDPSKNGLENLRPGVFFDSLLVPGVKPDEYVALTESTRILASPDRKRTDIEEPDYDLEISKLTKGHLLQTLRVIHFSRVTMLPYQQDIYDDHGKIATQATYEKYQTFNGVQFPTVITMNRPLDEYSLKVEITKLTLNETFEDDQFQLEIPAGVKVKELK